MTTEEAVIVLTAYPNGMWAFPDIIEWKKAQAKVKEAADDILRREAVTDGERR